jgi:hypothetical protein
MSTRVHCTVADTISDREQTRRYIDWAERAGLKTITIHRQGNMRKPSAQNANFAARYAALAGIACVELSEEHAADYSK